MPRSRSLLSATVAVVISTAALSCGGGDGGSPTTPTDNTASKPAQVLITPGFDTLNWIGATRQMSASVLNSTGGTLNVSVTWVSSATSVASVSAAGLVSAVGVGTTSIVAQAGTVSGAATIVVRQVPATITKVSGDGQTGTVGEILGSPLVVEIKDQGGAVATGAKLTWSVTQGGGKLEAESTEIDASGRGQASWRLGSTVGGQALQVSAGSLAPATFGAVGERLFAETVSLTPSVDTLDALGDTLRLTAVAKARSGAVIDNAQFTFTSTNQSVATVSNIGVVTAVAVGSAQITAQADSRADTALVVVRQVPASLVKVSGDGQSGSAGTNLSAPLVVEVRDARGKPIPGVGVSWSIVSGGGSVSPASATTDGAGKTQTTWRLGSTFGEQSAQASAAGMAAGFSAQAVEIPVASVDLLPTVDTAAAVGDTVRFTATARDANGNILTGVTFSFAVSDTSIATVNSSGLATAKATGTTKIIAAAGAKADTSTLVVGSTPPQPAVVITGVTPAVLVEGTAAVITGSGFAGTVGDNRVTVGGLTATITAATTTSLSITVPRADCQPPRKAAMAVTVGSMSDSRTVSVTPYSQSDLDLPKNYYRYTYAGNGCLYLPGDGAGGEFLIGVVSTSQTPSSLTPIMLQGVPGDASVFSLTSQAPSPEAVETVEASFPPAVEWRAPLRLAISGVVSQVATEQHDDAGMMERSEALVQALGQVSVPFRPARADAQAVAAGDTLTLYADHGRTCSSSEQIRAVVRVVGNNAVWLEDVANPSGTFSDQELADLDSFYAAKTKTVHDNYFGGLSDIDGNGRILILMTKQVNKVSGVAGWVWWGDLYPTGTCATSNQAEIFFAYVPDPTGVHGSVITKQSALGYYPSLLTHEITHIVQGNNRVFGSAGAKTTWEIEGGASLAEQLVAYRQFGHASGQNLGYAQYQVGAYWYWNAWLADMFQFFGWDTSGDATGRVAGAPEQCSWVGRSTEGNNGPCKGSAVYGVPSMVLRYAMDRWGGTYSGGEQGLVKRLAQSPYSGFSSLTDVSGWRIEQILADFYMALWADGRVYNAYGMSSWNLYDIFSRYAANRQLQPYTSSTASPQQTASIRAGSSLYLHWTPTGSLAPTSIKVTTPSGGPAPSNIAVWALRLR